MIVSASRRTDIPRFHLDWFLNRLKEGYALVRNPVNRTSVSRVLLDREAVDCIAFWTKDPTPLIDRVDELSSYPFYIQFTLNAYGNDVESALPRKAELIRTFQKLSSMIGPHRIVWRYSPILLSGRYTLSHHLHYFEVFSKELEGYTDCCRISFLDMYPKIERIMSENGLCTVPGTIETDLAKSLCAIGAAHGIEVGGCGSMDLGAAGMSRMGCVDARFVERACGLPVSTHRSAGSRSGCYCMPSVDIGAYDTCANGCIYCYANAAGCASAPKKLLHANPSSAMLCDSLQPDDTVTERKVTSAIPPQLSFGF